MAIIHNRYFWTAGYLFTIGWMGYGLMGLSAWEPVRNYKKATMKKF